MNKEKEAKVGHLLFWAKEEIVTINYRLASMNDLEEIVLLVQNAVAKMEEEDIHQWDALYPTGEDFENDIKNGNLYIGIAEGKIAVVFAVNQECDQDYRNGDWAYPQRSYFVLHRLCVNPAFQNRGVAAKTMQFIEAMLQNRGIQAIRLDVFSNNPYSQKLYARAGYVQTGVADWRMGRFYLMEKYIL